MKPVGYGIPDGPFTKLSLESDRLSAKYPPGEKYRREAMQEGGVGASDPPPPSMKLAKSTKTRPMGKPWCRGQEYFLG